MSQTLQGFADASRPRPPPIVVRRSEYRLLSGLALDALLREPRAAASLLDELTRSSVLDDAEVADHVAGLGSVVVFEDSAEGPAWRGQVELVEPDRAAPAEGRVSVLSSLGAALLGLSPGQFIDWNDRRGRTSRLTLLEVRRRDAREPAGGSHDL
jgi:regulator of nucleoside diphosphate kinase